MPPKLDTCKACSQSVSKSAKTCPHCGHQLKSGFFKKFLIGLAVIAGAVFVLGILATEDVDLNASANNEPTQEEIALSKKMPQQQIDFLSAIASARASATDAENNMQKGAALNQREASICALLPAGKQVNDWIGEVYSVDANNDGKGVLVVEIEDNAWVSTWNNAISDIGTNTLIEPDSALFSVASTLSSGDQITFSGEFFTASEGCISTQNFGLSSKVSRPEFVFKFSSVALLAP